MKSRPILFNAPMVRAVLDGSKTQTRRFFKGGVPLTIDGVLANKCLCGQVGDQLWVRETFCDATGGLHGRVLYRATGDTACKWKPSIFMPRAASRITLEITGVRVERLQDISEADAIAEGINMQPRLVGYDITNGCSYEPRNPIHVYSDLWESINGAGSWDLNPWVYVLEFKIITPI